MSQLCKSRKGKFSIVIKQWNHRYGSSSRLVRRVTPERKYIKSLGLKVLACVYRFDEMWAWCESSGCHLVGILDRNCSKQVSARINIGSNNRDSDLSRVKQTRFLLRILCSKLYSLYLKLVTFKKHVISELGLLFLHLFLH